MRGKWDLGPSAIHDALWAFCHVLPIREEEEGGSSKSRTDPKLRQKLKFPAGGASVALLSGKASLAQISQVCTGIACRYGPPQSVASAFTACEHTPPHHHTTREEGGVGGDCPIARIRAATWSSDSTNGVLGNGDGKTPAPHTAFVYGGLGMKQNLDTSQEAAGKYPDVETVTPLYDLWRFTADFTSAKFRWEEVHTGAQHPPSSLGVVWASQRRLFFLASKPLSDPVAVGSGTTSFSPSLWAFSLDDGPAMLGILGGRWWEHNDHVNPSEPNANALAPAGGEGGGEDGSHGGKRPNRSLWPGAEGSFLASADGSGWLLGGIGPAECLEKAAEEAGEGSFQRAQGTRGSRRASSPQPAALGSEAKVLTGLWKWVEPH